MNLKTTNSKYLSQIEQLAKQLLRALSASNVEDKAIYEDLTVLAIETHHEQYLRSSAEARQSIKEAADHLNTWEAEGGNTGVVIA